MKLADTPPVVCSSCYGQYPDRRHVDFESAWDGPTFTEGVATGDGEVRRNLTVAVDDLFLCENCILDAGRLLGIEPADKVALELEDAKGRMREMSERLAGQADYIAKLEQAAESRGRLDQALGVRGVTPQGPRKQPRAKAAA